MPKQKITCKSFYVDPSPHYEDTHPIQDNYYHRIIKAGDKIRTWQNCGHAIRKNICTNFIEGVVEEIDGILYIRVLRTYTSEKGYEPVEEQGPFKLVNNFVNRCYTITIIDKDNEKELKPIKKVKGGNKYDF